MGADSGNQVGLIFGGRSSEHEISIRSAQSVANAIDRRRFGLVLIGIDRVGRWRLHDERTFAALRGDSGAGHLTEVIPASRDGRLQLVPWPDPDRAGPQIDVVFPVVHGTFGEDGTLQGLLDMFDVPYVGAGVLGSAIGMDKDVQKRLLRDAQVPVVPFEVSTRHEWKSEPERVRRRVRQLGLPLFVKPANLGSSVGITMVREEGGLDAAIEHALRYDTKVVVEHGVNAREIECSVLGNEMPEASVPGEIVPGETFYSYADKYGAQSAARLIIPAALAEDVAAEIRRLAIRTFQVLELSGMARVDFFLERNTGRVYVNEVNTIPGFTSISMYPKLWEASGLSFRDLIGRLLDLAVARHRVRAALQNRPETSL